MNILLSEQSELDKKSKVWYTYNVDKQGGKVNNILQEQENRLAEIITNYGDELSEEQIRSLPLIAFGLSASKVSKIINISPTTIRQWMATDVNYRRALLEFADYTNLYHLARLNQAGVLAWDRIFEYLETDYDKEDKVNIMNQANTARFIISQLNVMNAAKEQGPQESKEQLHVSEASANIIARKVHELQKESEPRVIEQRAESINPILDVNDPRYKYNSMEAAATSEDYKREIVAAKEEPQYPMYPGAEYGKITYNEKTKKFLCHVCGEWCKDLVIHIRQDHQISPGRYRQMYGLPDDANLGIVRPVHATDEELEEYNNSLDKKRAAPEENIMESDELDDE